MICSQCGRDNKEGAKFCVGCGTAFLYSPDPAIYAGNPVPPPETDESYWDDEPETGGASDGYYEGTQARATEASDRLKEKKNSTETQRVSKWNTYAAVGFAFLIAALFLLSNVYMRATSPQRQAERFFVALANGKYAKAFSYFDIPQSEFANPTGLKQAAADFDLSEVKDYEVSGEGSMVTIIYRNKNSEAENHMSIALEQDEKTKAWKISPSQFFSEDAEIIVPQGAVCTVDDIPVAAGYAVDRTDEYYGDITAYTIPQLTRGSYLVKVKAEGRAEASRVWDGSGTIEILDLAYDTNTLTYLQQLAVYNMNQIYAAALKSQDFSTIENLFTADEGAREYIRNDYQYLVERLEGSDYQVTQVTFTDIRATGNNYSTSAYLQFNYQAVYNAKDWNGNPITDEIQNSYSTTFEFKQENGNWVQTSLGCSSLGF